MIKDNISIKKMSYTYLLSLLPLILYGFYKNGIYLYIKNYIGIFEVFKPILLILIGFLIGTSVNVIYLKLIKKSKDSLIDMIFSSFHPIYGVLIASIISINTNILLFSVVSFIVLFISKFFNSKVNLISLSSLIIFFIMNIQNKFTFMNVYEQSNSFKMNAIDYMFGRGSGGILTTNILLIVVSFIILYNSKLYKKSIAINSSCVFIVLTSVYCMLTNNIGNIMNMLFTNGILFSFVYVATEPVSSSYTKYGKEIYGVIVGVLTFLFYLINPTLSSLGGILIASIFNSLIDMKFE